MIPWQMTEYWRYHKYLVLFVLNDQQMGTFHKIELSIIGHFANVGFIVFSLVFFTLKVYQEFKPMWQIIEKWLISQSMQCLKWSEASTLVGTAVYFPERPICSQIQINENRESCQKCRLQLNLKGVRTLFKFVTKKMVDDTNTSVMTIGWISLFCLNIAWLI